MENISRKFDDEFIETWFDKVRFWFLIRKIRRQKIAALIESNIDKLFYETEQADLLSFDDTEARAALAAENRKPDGTKDMNKIAELEETITNAKTAKGGYYKNEKFHNELRTYILMLDKCIKAKQQPQEPKNFGHSDL